MIIAVAALLLSGGVFMKANQQKIGFTANELLLENLTAVSDPAMPTGFAVSGRRAVDESGTCGIVGSKYVEGSTEPIWKSPVCHISMKEVDRYIKDWKRENYSISWCCDSCKDTWYCPN